MKNRVIRTLTLAVMVIALIAGMSVSAMASSGEVRLSTEVNGQFVQLYFPAGSEAAIAYNRDVKPLLPNGIGRMSDAAITAMEAWKNKYASSSQAPSVQSTPQTAAPAQPLSPELIQQQRQEFADEIIRLVNIEREKAGLSPLTVNTVMMEAAAVRANELSQEPSHTRPDGRRFETALTDAGYSYNRVGENLARGVFCPENTMERWMNSPGHRANILGNYTQIGVGVDDSGAIQLFASPKTK